MILYTLLVTVLVVKSMGAQNKGVQRILYNVNAYVSHPLDNVMSRDALNESEHPIFFKVNATVLFAGFYNLSDLAAVLDEDDVATIKILRRMDATVEDKEYAVGNVLRDAYRKANATDWPLSMYVPAANRHKLWNDTTRWNLTLNELAYKPYDKPGQMARDRVFFSDTVNNYQLHRNWGPVCRRLLEEIELFRKYNITPINPDEDGKV